MKSLNEVNLTGIVSSSRSSVSIKGKTYNVIHIETVDRIYGDMSYEKFTAYQKHKCVVYSQNAQYGYNLLKDKSLVIGKGFILNDDSFDGQNESNSKVTTSRSVIMLLKIIVLDSNLELISGIDGRNNRSDFGFSNESTGNV